MRSMPDFFLMKRKDGKRNGQHKQNIRPGIWKQVPGLISCHIGKFVLYDKAIRGMRTARIRKMAAGASALRRECMGIDNATFALSFYTYMEISGCFIFYSAKNTHITTIWKTERIA